MTLKGWELGELSHYREPVLSLKLAFSDSCNNLPPEIGATARLTLDYQLSFEMLGDGLRLFSGSALRELAGFRKTCRNNIVSCLKTFLDAHRGLSKNIWVCCPKFRPQLSIPLHTFTLERQTFYASNHQAFEHPREISGCSHEAQSHYSE
ncbi:hypothetical protein F5888DRAFT_1053471 [Russula emetica]|nr:hypothetical protein F5888DRAFT_1053471 [Russula emetica]